MLAVRSAMLHFVALALGCLAGCQTTPAEDVTTTAWTARTAPASAWDASFTPPASLDTSRVHLEPLGPALAQLDYDAFMSSREHLHRTLHWGSWPRADATVEANREDLKRHEREFVAREGYAYTVLTPKRDECVGCVYMNPVDGDPRAVDLNYWVVESRLSSGLDEHLVATIIDWVRRDWPFDTIVMQVHTDNERGVAIVEGLGLESEGSATDAEHIVYRWRRP